MTFVLPLRNAFGARWKPYTPVLTSQSGTWTNATLTGLYRVINKMLEVSFKIAFTGVSTTASNMYISLPAGLTIDVAGLAGGGGWDTDPAGFAILGDNGVVSGVPGIINVRTSTTVLVKYTDDNDAGEIIGKTISNTAPWTWASIDTVSGQFSVPIL